MKHCPCPIPQPKTNPRHTETCQRCGFYVDPELKRIDRQVEEFFDRLAESQFHYGPDGKLLTPDWWDDFREHCQIRELAGREEFGLDYLARDNPVEASEEATDGALYMLLHGLRGKREDWPDDIDVRLTAAYHFAMAHRYSRMVGAKQRGNTGPGFDG